MQEKKLQIIKNSLGNNLLSTLKYQRFKTLITIFVIKKVDFQNLDLLRAQFQNENFIIFNESDIINGKDVFPLDFLHIKNNHILVEGADYFSNININKKHLQLKLEFELRNKLIYLREQYLLTSKRNEFLSHVIPTFIVFLDGLLFLKDLEYTNDVAKNISNIENSYNVDLKVITQLLSKDSKDFSAKETNEIIQTVNDVLVELSLKVDKIS